MGKIAFVFAGQGAQFVGMGQELWTHSDAAHSVFGLAELHRPGTRKLCFEGPLAELSETINTQPCLYAMDLACAQALTEAGVVADCAAGFSLGEVAAAAFAGMVDLEAGFRLVCERARLMQACAQRHPSAMAAVLKLSASQVEALCGQFRAVYPVNYNCPGQIAVAGDREEMDVFSEQVAQLGGKAVRLNVSGGFHSPFMDQAAEGLRAALEPVELLAPSIPLYANLTGRPYEGALKDTLASQVNHPVRWQDTIERMVQDGVDTFIEVGAGKTLTGLIKKIGGARALFAVQDMKSLDACVQALKGGAAC